MRREAWIALVCLLALQARGADSLSLTERLRAIAGRAGGETGVTVIHLESGERVAVNGDASFPLYSVFKLPVAIVVLREVEAGRVRLDDQVRQLLQDSLNKSDNTASDKLLALAGGPAAVTAKMHALGFRGIEVRASTRDFVNFPEHPNRASANAIAALLSSLQRGELLQPRQRDLLRSFMTRSRPGERRIRGNLPPGTPVVSKSGTHSTGASVNDVGVITLPDGAGHLAIAVLMSRSKLTPYRQEDVIAAIARAAFDAFVR